MVCLANRIFNCGPLDQTSSTEPREYRYSAHRVSEAARSANNPLGATRETKAATGRIVSAVVSGRCTLALSAEFD